MKHNIIITNTADYNLEYFHPYIDVFLRDR